MKRHQLFSIFDAPQDVYYPKVENIITNVGWGATTTAGDSEFDTAGRHAIFRSILVAPTAGSGGSYPTILIRDGNGDKVAQYITGADFGEDLLFGPDGVKIPEGFSVEVLDFDGGYISIVYDVS